VARHLSSSCVSDPEAAGVVRVAMSLSSSPQSPAPLHSPWSSSSPSPLVRGSAVTIAAAKRSFVVTGANPACLHGIAHVSRLGGAGVASFSTDTSNVITSTPTKYETTGTDNETSRKREQLQQLEEDGLCTTDQFNEVIVGYTEIGDVAKADEILSKMENVAKARNSSAASGKDDSPSSIAMPDIDSYTAVIDAWLAQQVEVEAKEKGTECRGDVLRAAERIDAILRRMEHASESSSASSTTDKAITPLSHHYDAAVTAWSRCVSRGPVYAIRGIPQRAQAVLERMEALSLNRSSGVRPTVETYNKVIEAWGNSGEYAFAPLAQAVYERMENGPAAHLDIRPNDKTIRTMVRVWARSDLKNAAFHATGHLMKLQELLEAGAEEMEPTLDDYLTILKCWATAEDKHAARRAQTVLKQMERLYLNRTSDVRPTVACYRYVLIAMSNSRLSGLGPKADDLMSRMEDRLLVADSTCFGATIKVWSNSACHKDTKNAQPDAERADDVLQQMKEMYHRSSQIVVKPVTCNYNDVLRAYSMCKGDDSAAWRAEELLDEMNELAREGDTNVMPDTDSYISTMNALARSKLPDKIAKSMRLLNQIIDRFQQASGGEKEAAVAKPTVDCYHAMVKVCASIRGASSEERSVALRTAIRTVKMLKESDECSTNSETYRQLIEASGKLLSPGTSEQTQALKAVFTNCCRDGLVDDKVLKQFRKAAPTDLYEETVLFNSKTSSDANGMVLPEGWTRNIGHKVRTADGRKPQPLSPDVGFVVTPSMVDYKMRRLRSRKNQRLLRGGRS